MLYQYITVSYFLLLMSFSPVSNIIFVFFSYALVYFSRFFFFLPIYRFMWGSLSTASPMCVHCAHYTHTHIVPCSARCVQGSTRVGHFGRGPADRIDIIRFGTVAIGRYAAHERGVWGKTHNIFIRSFYRIIRVYCTHPQQTYNTGT